MEKMAEYIDVSSVLIYLIFQKEYPQYNFMGLILGPRGNTLDKIKQKYNCKIIIRNGFKLLIVVPCVAAA